MSATTTRSLADRAGAANRMIRALGNDLTEWDVEDLNRIGQMEVNLAILRTAVIHALRTQGVTDKQIGEELGVTQQAVSKRWPGGGRYVGAAGRYRTQDTTTEGAD
jgi:hypothetical protein